MAAVASVQNFIIVLQAHDPISKTAPKLLGAYLTLYNALTDDDEEVRDQAAEVVSSLLSVSACSGESEKTASLSLSPLASIPRLLQFLGQEYNTSLGLCLEAVHRVTGAYSPKACLSTGEALVLRFSPVRALLEEAMSTDNALFVEEKQNLFVDEVKEAELWAGVLLNLRPGLNAKSKSILESWALDGISVLMAIARDEVDGPLGWTSKPEVFTIGMRVIVAAKYVLNGDKRDDSLPVKMKCHQALKAFRDVAREKTIHELWLREINEALEVKC